MSKLKKFICAANWKMHKAPLEAARYAGALAQKVQREPSVARQAILFVPAIDLSVVGEALRGSAIGWGAQTCHWESKGAFTGETSPEALAEISTGYCLVGHSERRALFGETDEMTGKKVKSLQAFGIRPMLCVGESLEEREGGRTDQVVERQLRAGLAQRNADGEAGPGMIVAYEPVWAIGTGQVASPEQANAAHVFVRRTLRAIGGDAFAEATPILYGGSVRPENSDAIGGQPEVDGFLVGGASLELETFWALVRGGK